MAFYPVVKDMCRSLSANPSLLVTKASQKIVMKLKENCSKNQSSTANGTNQEFRFAEVAETCGFAFLKKGTEPETDGLYYQYQVNGSQKKGDFALLSYEKGKKKQSLIVEMKHANMKSIMLNDGWFDDDTLYIITYDKGMCVHIALGQDVPSEDEKTLRKFAIKMKSEMNLEIKKMHDDVCNLKVYMRFANGYNCKEFPSKKQEVFKRLEDWLDKQTQTLEEIQPILAKDDVADLINTLSDLKV
jgi:hypothetical protein